jgi:hypothetical protein
VQAQEHSIARQWNELLLEAIRTDFARPTVHARNLFHTSVAMYDAWAVYDSTARTYLLGDTINGYVCPYDPEMLPELSQEILDTAQHVAISYAAYRLLKHRFEDSPGAPEILNRIDQFMADTLGYLTAYTNTDYTNGSPAAMGNYIAQCVINFGFQDGANELGSYVNQYYETVNEPLVVDQPGNPDILDPNRWQPLTLETFIDQGGNPIDGNTPDFLSPEWGLVTPFALSEEDLNIYERDGNDYWVYHDPGPPPYLDFDNPDALTEEYQWGFMLVALWSSHLSPDDGVMWDISPASIGNYDPADFPTDMPGLQDFYNLIEGGDPSPGHTVNPVTGQPYEPNMVARGDYARVLAEFWADGPDSETPPGHWFTIINYVNDHPQLVKRFRGEGPVLDDLEWDVKSYLTLGGAMHDVAITAWGIKGYYDYIRPISAIRHMADLGQSTDPELPSYHPEGIPLVPGYVELVEPNTPLAGVGNIHANKIKLYAWRGPDWISDPETDDAGVDWILAENWWPYQRPSFVTPPFAGYISGHSTYSRAAAEVLTLLTGTPYFPGGMGIFHVEENEFLVFEEGPSQSFDLQWATYQDASDQCSLSRIWGGIHPPADDIPGRLIGMEVGVDAFHKAESYFFADADMDGYLSNQDCDDNDPNINPGMPETCDGIDNNCDGLADEGLTIYTYYRDMDEDGFGAANTAIDTCDALAPVGFVSNGMDCDDSNPDVNPDAIEICDNLDNDCNGIINDGFEISTYYRDLDVDGFGDTAQPLDTCLAVAPEGYSVLAGDCDDQNPDINPTAPEVCDEIDNNCNGILNDGLMVNTFFADNDNDGYGNPEAAVDTCIATIPEGFVMNDEDCDDENADINPAAEEIPNNGIDEDCDGMDLVVSTFEEQAHEITVYPNPVNEQLFIQYEGNRTLTALLYYADGRLAIQQPMTKTANRQVLDMSALPSGVYFLQLRSPQGAPLMMHRIVKW